MTKPTPNLTLGFTSAVIIIFIWSGFLVFSRAGVTSNLTPYDMVALRFMVAGAMVLPFCKAWWPGHLPLKVKVLMAVCGPGVIYAMFMFFGLTGASAAYGGVFSNGSLPIFTLLLVYFVTGAKPNRNQLLGISAVVCGGILLGIRGMLSGGEYVVMGIVLFLSASAVLSTYIFGLRHWNITPKQALVLVNLPSALLFIPIWYVFLPSGMADTELSVVVFHGLYQGMGPGFLAVIFFTLSAKHLGPTLTAGFSAVVPATAALLAIPVLGEIPSTMEWSGIVLVSIGLGVMVLKPKGKLL